MNDEPYESTGATAAIAFTLFLLLLFSVCCVLVLIGQML